MSDYLVTARRWRPALFQEIVGQEHVTRTLKNAVRTGKIAHAYIFSGPRGVGKTTAARILAKCLNCSSGPTPDPCNACDSCKGIATGASVDVLEIDGASNTSVDNVRELRESIRFVPVAGKYRVYIIDEVHMLSGSAFNALLKTLEEPPPHAVFIFATTEAHKIPATILSRCQRFDFRRIPSREIHGRLKTIVDDERLKVSDDALWAIVRESDGSMRDAQSLLDQVAAFAGDDISAKDVSSALGLMDRTLIFGLAQSLCRGEASECLNIVEKICDFGYDLKRATGDLIEQLRDLTVVKVTGEAGLLDLPDSEVERVTVLASNTALVRLQLLFGIVSKGYEEVARSAHPRYSLEMALIKAASTDDMQPIAELIRRLDALKGRMSSGAPPAPPAAPKAPPARGAASMGAGAAAQAVTRSPAHPPVFSRPLSGAPPQGAQTEKAPVERAPEDSAPCEDVPVEGKAKAGGSITGLLRERIPSLSGVLEMAVIREGADEVEFTVQQEHGALLKIKEKQLEGVLAEFYGKKMKVAVKASSVKAKKDGPEPLVKEAVRVFDGKVLEERRRKDV